jgi:hypothetical protein
MEYSKGKMPHYREEKITVEKIAQYMKVAEEIRMGRDANDFIHSELTAMLYGWIATAAKESGTIDVYVPAPSFFDWLFRRNKTISVPYTIKALAKWDERFNGKKYLQIINK